MSLLYLRPMMYKATPAFHLDASSTPSQAKETATATIVKNIVMLGLQKGGKDNEFIAQANGGRRKPQFHLHLP